MASGARTTRCLAAAPQPLPWPCSAAASSLGAAADAPMIAYDAGDYHLGFIFQKDGSTLPKASCFAFPSMIFALSIRFFLNWTQEEYIAELAHQASPSSTPASTLVWTITFFVLSLLLTFRCNKAYNRFWDGCELVQAMSAEWFESCSLLVAFSCVPVKQAPDDPELAFKVKSFQFRLVHLMSLLHGMALHQIGGEEGEDIEVLDIFGLDQDSLDYLTHTCNELEINRVEVILHWIQVLITESIYEGVLTLPPPILTRSYQTLSRGMVNLHNVRRIADIPFPFPLSQALIILLIVHSILTPIVAAIFFTSFLWVAIVSFFPILGMWSLVFVSGEMEQPFGNDANDLPLTMQQFDFHTSLMMLVDDQSMRVPFLTSGAAMTVRDLRERFGNADSNTAVLHPKCQDEKETMRQALKKRQTANLGSFACLEDLVLTHEMNDNGDTPDGVIPHAREVARTGFTPPGGSRNGSKMRAPRNPTTAMLMRQRSNLSSNSEINGVRRLASKEAPKIHDAAVPSMGSLTPTGTNFDCKLAKELDLPEEFSTGRKAQESPRSRSHEPTHIKFPSQRSPRETGIGGAGGSSRGTSRDREESPESSQPRRTQSGPLPADPNAPVMERTWSRPLPLPPEPATMDPTKSATSSPVPPATLFVQPLPPAPPPSAWPACNSPGSSRTCQQLRWDVRTPSNPQGPRVNPLRRSLVLNGEARNDVDHGRTHGVSMAPSSNARRRMNGDFGKPGGHTISFGEGPPGRPVTEPSVEPPDLTVGLRPDVNAPVVHPPRRVPIKSDEATPEVFSTIVAVVPPSCSLPEEGGTKLPPVTFKATPHAAPPALRDRRPRSPSPAGSPRSAAAFVPASMAINVADMRRRQEEETEYVTV